MTALRHDLIRLAVRTQLAAMTVSTTGSTTLGSTTTAFTRPSGSFLTDGFEPGMQVNATGFATSGNNGLATVTAVAALSMTVDKTLVADSDAASRTLVVGAPDKTAYEDVEFKVPNNEPWLREILVSGARRMLTAPATGGLMEFDPLLYLDVMIPENSGPGAGDRYADAIMESFKPNTALSLSDGSTAKVRTDAGSFRSRLLNQIPGYSGLRVTVPLRLHLTNAA